jgi:hypothetical protein
MGLEILGRERAGRVLLKDDREDGTIILLVCEEAGIEPSGLVVHPDREEDGEGDGPFPTGAHFAQLERRGAATEGFTLSIDTSKMPSQIMKFDMEQFVSMAINSAEHGVREVALTTDEAPLWGYIPPTSLKGGSRFPSA